MSKPLDNAPPIRERPLSTKEVGILRSQIRKAQAHPYLNGSELGFLKSMAVRIRAGFCLSEHQRSWLNDIFGRARVHRHTRP